MSLFYNFLKRIVLTLFCIGIATNAMARVCFLPGIENCDGYVPGYDVNPDISCASYDGFDSQPACETNLPKSQTCSANNGCYYRMCQYNSQTACEKGLTSNKKCLEDTDNSCFYRELKTCVEINKNYLEEKAANEKGDSYTCSKKADGKNGGCYICSKKKCTDYKIPGSLVRTSCDTKKYDVEETEWTDGENSTKCVKCTLKSCTKLTPAHSVPGTCKNSQTEVSAGVSGSEGACVDCLDNSYVITVNDTPTFTATDNYGYDITIKRSVTSTGSRAVDATSTGYLYQNGEGKQTINVANKGSWRIYRNNDENGTETSSQTVDWNTIKVKLVGTGGSAGTSGPAGSLDESFDTRFSTDNPLKACESGTTISASDGKYVVQCLYGENDESKPTCEKINSNYKSSGDCTSGTKVDAGISDAEGNKCFYCKQDESDDLCIKIVFKCNGETCSDSDLKEIGILDTLTYGNEDGLVRSEYSQQSTCYHKKDILDMIEKRGADYEAQPYVAITVDANVYDYNQEHQNENNYVFVDGQYDSSLYFTRYLAVTNHNGTLQYTLIKNHESDDSGDIGMAVVPGEYVQCLDKLCGNDADICKATNDELYECFWGNKDIKPVPSTPIEIPIELAKFNGAQKCVYYAATCYNLPQNASNDGRLGYSAVKNSNAVMGNYYGFDIDNWGGFIVPNYPNNQIAQDCISSARIEVTDSGDASRNNTVYTMTQMTTEQLKKKYTETQNEFFNPQKDTVVLQNCELQDWDKGIFEVTAENGYTEFFDLDYKIKYKEENNKNSCTKRYFFDDAYYDMENNKVTVGYYSYLDLNVCLGEVNELIEYMPGYPANGNFTYFPITYKFAYSGGYDFLTFENNYGMKTFKELKWFYRDDSKIKKSSRDIMLQDTLYPTILLSTSYTSREYVYNGSYCVGTDINATQKTATLTASRPVTTDLTISGYSYGSSSIGNNISSFGKKGYKHYEYTTGDIGKRNSCIKYDDGHWTYAEPIGEITINEWYKDTAVCAGTECEYFFTDDNYFYYWNK